MAPFEPKTDSKEFELANAEPAARVSTGAADITIRLWRQDQASGASALSWNTESVLVYMMADLVAASHGRAAPESSAVMTAHFDNSNQAIVAAKRIQLAILEFVTFRPGDFLGAAVLVHPTVAAGFRSGTAQGALRLAEPGQIILSEVLGRGLQDLPGIELRPVAALTTGGTEHAGLSELVWASPEQIAKLRESARSRPTGVTASPAMGATMIVNSPLGARSGAGPDKAGAATPNVSQPQADERRTHSRDGAFEEGLAEFQQHRSFVTRTRAVIAVVAIVLVGVAVALFYPSARSKVPLRAPEVQSRETPTTPVPTTEPLPPQPPVQQVPDSHVKVQPPPVNKQPVSKQPAKAARDQGKDNAKRPEDTPIQGFEGSSTYDGMTQKDIPSLLLWARSDAGNGRYEKAGQEYRVILLLQPNNPDAREGLRKLQLAQQRDQ